MLIFQDDAAVEAAEARLAGRDPDAAAIAGADGGVSTSGSDSDSDEDGSIGEYEERGAAHISLLQGSGSRSPVTRTGSKDAEHSYNGKAHSTGRTRHPGSKTMKRRKIQEL